MRNDLTKECDMKGTGEKSFVPAIRFSEFETDGEWKEKRLGDLCKIGNGKDYKHLNKGCIPVYGSGGYITSVDSFLYDGDSVCIGRKGTIDRPIFLTGKFWTVDTLFYTHSFCSCLPKFLYWAFQQIDWYKYNEAGGVPSLSKKTIENIKQFIPSFFEQQKIAECLTTIDEEINAMKEKVEHLKTYKKGIMQKLFPVAGKFLPEVRFSEFKKDGEWAGMVLGNMFERILEKNVNNNQNVLTISAQYGLVSQYDYFNKNVAAANVRNYYFIRKGDFAYNKSRSQGYPFGVIKPLRRYESGVVSTLYICFRSKENCCIDFYEQYFDTDLINNEIGKIAQEGARNHGLLNISVDDFFNKIKILVPSQLEQQKIAKCFSSIDELIGLYESKVALLEQHKKGLMQQLFPKI